MEIGRIHENFDLRKEYDISCSECGHSFFIRPSALMYGGINSGHGSCPKCNTFLRFTIDLNLNLAFSKIWKPCDTTF